MDEVVRKKILLISPVFFGYEKKYKENLKFRDGMLLSVTQDLLTLFLQNY